MPPAAQSGSSGETQAAAPPPDGVRTRSTDYQYVIWLFYAVVSLGLLASAVFVSPKHAMMALLWAMACFVSGGALGFIFGIPKVLQQQTAEAGAPADTTARPAARERANYRQEVNTNLTEISDWLTKMIVGVSLVNLKDIPPFIKSVAQVFALGMASSDPNRDFLPYCVAIIMFFTVLGFLFGYLSTRLYLAPAFARADVDAQAPVALALRGEVAILSATVAALTDVSMPAKPASAAPPTAASTAPTGGATSMPAGGVPSVPAMPSPSPPVTQSSATPPQVLSAQEQAISAAQRALEANSIVDERQRITAKDQVANEIARLVIEAASRATGWWPKRHARRRCGGRMGSLPGWPSSQTSRPSHRTFRDCPGWPPWRSGQTHSTKSASHSASCLPPASPQRTISLTPTAFCSDIFAAQPTSHSDSVSIRRRR